MKQCMTCGGRYEPILPDGMQYFHACPPVRELLDELGTPIDAPTAAGLQKLGKPVFERFVERLNKRDENVVPAPDPTKDAQPKAEGAGAIEIAAKPDALAGAMPAGPIALPVM